MNDEKKTEESAEERGKKMIEMEKKVAPVPEQEKEKKQKENAEQWRNEG